MVNSHREDVALFQNQAQHGEDDSLKGFAQQTVPTLENHLQQAEQVSQQLGS